MLRGKAKLAEARVGNGLGASDLFGDDALGTLVAGEAPTHGVDNVIIRAGLIELHAQLSIKRPGKGYRRPERQKLDPLGGGRKQKAFHGSQSPLVLPGQCS